MDTGTRKPRDLHDVAHLFLSTWKKDETNLETKPPESARVEVPFVECVNLPAVSFVCSDETVPHSFVLNHSFSSYLRKQFKSIKLLSYNLPYPFLKTLGCGSGFPAKPELRKQEGIGLYSLGDNRDLVYLSPKFVRNLNEAVLERCDTSSLNMSRFADTLCLVAYPDESHSAVQHILPLIDKLVLVVSPSVESLKEGFRRVKFSLRYNRFLQLYLLVLGEPDSFMGEWLYSRFSRLVSRFLNQTVTFLGFCPLSFFAKDSRRDGQYGAFSLGLDALIGKRLEGTLSCEKLTFMRELARLKA
ncbi:MAG: hypothetical protein PHE61_02920 [Candidatus Omnitrophica bacterium]|nr:hypothetical protein [Candidatus Omnitrophota bacterium]